ncbi:MAG: hypothetical protein GEU74_12130 [Nitriliruptorales bacterium]|nr:hypothetical protein [Nitriliruptorales bacterium]
MERNFDTALAHATEAWMAQDGVGAVGQGEADGEPTIDVWITPTSTQSFPESFEGYRVIVRPLGGEIHAQGEA